MAFLYRGQQSTAENPILDLYTSFDSSLIDVAEVSFAIFDVSTEQKMALYRSANKNDVQIYPVTPGTRLFLDVAHLVTDPTPGQKLGTGHYFAPWQAPAGVSTGNYIIVWSYKAASDALEQLVQEEFVIVAEGAVAGSSFTEKLRLYMLDYFSRNELLDKVEYSPQQYDFALEQAVMRFNVMTPLSQFTVASMPAGTEYLFILGGAGHLMRSTSIEQLRNQLTYTDGNVHVGLTDKHQAYLAAGQMHIGEFDQMARSVKNYLNNEAAWGTSHSPLMTLNYPWGYR